MLILTTNLPRSVAIGVTVDCYITGLLNQQLQNGFAKLCRIDRSIFQTRNGFVKIVIARSIFNKIGRKILKSLSVWIRQISIKQNRY